MVLRSVHVETGAYSLIQRIVTCFLIGNIVPAVGQFWLENFAGANASMTVALVSKQAHITLR